MGQLFKMLVEHHLCHFACARDMTYMGYLCVEMVSYHNSPTYCLLFSATISLHAPSNNGRFLRVMSNSPQQSPVEHGADRQAREVYRYFQPGNPAALNEAWPSFGDHLATPADLPTPNPSSILSSPNATLTSLAQLAALRLNAQRAFITYTTILPQRVPQPNFLQVY